LLLPVAANQSV